MFKDLQELISEVSAIVRPPERLTVAEAAARYRNVYNPGSFVGRWDNDITPYNVEFQDVLTSLDFTGAIFVGPARCGKSDIFFNWLLHTQECDPADMMRLDMTQATSRDWSQGDLARFLRHNPLIGEKLTPGRHADNVHDKHFKSGTRLLIKWPTITELSGKTVPRVWLADYDRIPSSGNIDGEGPAYDLGRKRTGTFRRYGMTVAESSPGYSVTDSKRILKGHEAPPTGMEGDPGGILALYNRGDRRRWYWKCADCGLPYEPSFAQMRYPETDDIFEAAAQARMECPHCEYQIAHDPDERSGRPGKHQMNLTGRWVKEGQIWTREGEITGTPLRSNIASFWLKGPAAGLTDWETIVSNYLKAKREFEDSGSEESLKSVMGLDLGEPHVPVALQNDRLPEELKSRVEERPLGMVPMGTRFMIATVDVQKTSFQIQVHGQRANGDIDIIDRFAIKKSDRLDADGDPYPISPGAHPEDWRKLVPLVIQKTYPLIDGSGRHMQMRMVLCDSGGEKGVAAQALNFWRWLKRPPENESDNWEPGLHNRFLLVRGTGNRNVPSVRLTYPDAHRKDRHSGARGDVPILAINTNVLKDDADKRLARVSPGGRVNFPKGLPDNVFTELCVEVRNEKLQWENLRNARNESWDLLVYFIAGTLTNRVNITHINWESPPSWAADWDDNSMVVMPGVKKAVARDVEKDLDKLARLLA